MAEQPATTGTSGALRRRILRGLPAGGRAPTGRTDAWEAVSGGRRATPKADWALVRSRAEAVGAGPVAAMDASLPATSEAAMDAEAAGGRSTTGSTTVRPRCRGLAGLHIGPGVHRTLPETTKGGMAQYVHDAIHANADRAERRAGTA